MAEIIFFGILQGLLEWLPISSQGNLVLAMVGIFGYEPEKAITLSLFLHIGTLLVVLVYFRKEIKEILIRFKGGQDKIISFLFISSVVSGLVGLPFFLLLTAPILTGEILIALTGLFLIITGILQKRVVSKELKEEKNITLKDSLLLGVAQGFSVIPGLSRSGITVSALLLRSYKVETALKLSFLMSVPAVLMAQIGIILFQGLPAITMAEGMVGLSSAFFSGILSIHLFLKLARQIKFWLFCIVLGIIALIPLFFLV